MPVVIKNGGARGKAEAAAAKAPQAPLNLTLPTARSKPLTALYDYSWLIYGDPGVGKTSLVGMLGETFMMMCEPGGKALPLLQRPVTSWREAKGYLALLKGKGGKAYQAVCIDGLDLLYQYCYEYWCEKKAVNHPTEANDHGQTWKMLEDDFRDFCIDLMNLGKGTFFIAHAEVRKISPREGMEYDKMVPELGKQAWNVIEPLVDMIAYYGDFAGCRQLSIRGDSFVATKCRPDELFLTPKGRLIRSIPTGNSKHEAVAALKKAFDRKQVTVGDVPTVKQTPPKEKRGR